ncbi:MULTISPECIES: Hsp20/alpha crystallin family protein [unclassified Imperialibacter]|uniref:Hsp20/alpha crystallin family protein n=1 Tax=unclassified Imperialibacter TaxID=2629706 RepID=UPI001256E72E|nr:MULTISPECIES: Hsp20/alpha crystallin family protein [unclassified Imperialibacter]CAD5279806.1 HSP20 family protein [Imperialibacter sp. 75]CAD5288440.1 HSP20 family protein [Imperialibacter sp. 89]VVT15888.1 HSP20 family protein [Imperialibacter sp. EC-SDR9]
MSLALRTRAGVPTLLSDWLRPALFDRDIFDFDGDLFPSRLGVNTPSVNVKETPKEFLLEVAAPGLERKDFNIEVKNGALCISAEKEDEKEEQDGYYRREYSYNSFSRSFSLPDNVKEDKIDAKYDKGILKVSLPKKKETPAEPVHKIAVS